MAEIATIVVGHTHQLVADLSLINAKNVGILATLQKMSHKTLFPRGGRRTDIWSLWNSD